MDPWNSAQDVVRCTLCVTSVAPMYCEVCHIHLCKNCVENHLADSSIIHNVVSLKQYWGTLNYPKCRKHITIPCDIHCNQCDIPICTKCISSGSHLGHKHVDIFRTFEDKKEILQRELQELEELIYPKYQEIAANIPVQRADLKTNSQKLTTTFNKRREVWHREIDTIFTNLKSNVDEMEFKHLVVLNKEEAEISSTISEIKQTISHLKKLLKSRDICLVSDYKSRNAKFRILPPKLKVSLPNFQPRKIFTDHLTREIGFLSALSFIKEDPVYLMPTQGADSSPPNRPLKDVPRVITDIATGNEKIYDVTCLHDTEIWVCGGVDNMMKLFNLNGELVKSVQTKSGKIPCDIAVTRSGDLVYTDYKDRTVNIVKDTQIETVIKLQGWRPRGVCSTSSGDLLVVMERNGKPSKVVRFSGSTETQSIQFNDKEQPLYSSGDCVKYISENRNLDICVSDMRALAVVVVDQAGKHRFNYNGRPFVSPRLLNPNGIATDSQGLILISDCMFFCIHILDQDGQFIRLIRDLPLRPTGVCVDSRDHIFVAEDFSGKVKKIKYYM